MPEKRKTQIDHRKMVDTQEIHCSACGRFIGYQAILWGIVRIKCPNCKQWLTIDVCPDR